MEKKLNCTSCNFTFSTKCKNQLRCPSCVSTAHINQAAEYYCPICFADQGEYKVICYIDNSINTACFSCGTKQYTIA